MSARDPDPDVRRSVGENLERQGRIEELRSQAARQSDRFGEEDIAVVEREGRFEARPTERARRRELRRDLLSDAPEGIGREDIIIDQTDDGLRGRVDPDALEGVAERRFQQARAETAEDLDERFPEVEITAEDIALGTDEEGTEVFEVSEETRRDIAAARVDEQFSDVDITAEDITLGTDEEGEEIFELTETTQHEIAAVDLDEQFPEVEITAEDITLGTDEEGAEVFEVSEETRQEIAAQQLDEQIPGMDIGVGDITRDDGEFQLRENVQREIAAQKFSEQLPIGISPDDVTVEQQLQVQPTGGSGPGKPTLQDIFGISEEVEQEVAASQIDQQLPGVDVGVGDIEETDEGMFVFRPEDRDFLDLEQTIPTRQGGGPFRPLEDTIPTRQTVAEVPQGPRGPGALGMGLGATETGEVDVLELFGDIRSGAFQEQLDERTREEFEEQAAAQRRGEGILPPRSEIIDTAGETARGPDFLDTPVGEIATGQFLSPVDDPAAAREGVGRGLAKIFPLNPFQATLETAELAEEGEEFVGNVRTGVVATGEERQEAQQEVKSDVETAGVTAAATPGLLRTEVEERPFETLGAALGLVGGGIAGGRAIERAPGLARSARIRAKGGKIHPWEDVSDPPRVLRGGLPGFSREVVDDPAAARREFFEQAEQNVVGGDAPTVFHGRAAEDVRRFGAMTEEFEAPEAPVRPKDTPGMTFSADLSPLRIPGVGEAPEVTGISSPIRAPRPRLRAPARIAAEEDVDVGIMQGETIPGASQFMETADPEQSFIRSRGIMSPEQEAFAPEGSTFTPTGEAFGVRAGRDIIPGRTFRRGEAGEATEELILGQQLAEESTEARRMISSSARRADQSGEPFIPGLGSVDPSAPGPTESTIPGNGPTSPPSTPPTAPTDGPTVPGSEDVSVPGTPTDPPTTPPSEPPTGPPSEPPTAPPSTPPTAPPSVPPSIPPTVTEPPTTPPSRPPTTTGIPGAPSSPPPTGPPSGGPPIPERVEPQPDEPDREDEFLFGGEFEKLFEADVATEEEVLSGDLG